MKEKLLALIAERSDITQAMAARELGVSRQRINQVCRREGIELARAAQAPKRSSPMSYTERRKREVVNHFGVAGARPNPTFTGAASEMTVVADLLRRGISVYRAVAHVAPFDIVADYKGALVRVEVRSARLGSTTLPPRAKYDVLALVFPDGNVTYRPNEGVTWF